MHRPPHVTIACAAMAVACSATAGAAASAAAVAEDAESGDIGVSAASLNGRPSSDWHNADAPGASVSAAAFSTPGGSARAWAYATTTVVHPAARGSGGR